MQLSIGFSPCPNDTFMLDALIHQRLKDNTISWTAHIEDVETLNQWALAGKLDVTKLSFATWLRVQNRYDLLSAGMALGRGCGPLVISRQPLTKQEIEEGPVAIPGELTTANLLFSLRFPDAKHKIPMVFSAIETAVIEGRVKAGVIIHENRFTYAAKGLHKVIDLGEYWEEATGCPIPLGAFAIRNDIAPDVREKVNSAIRESVLQAFKDPEMAMPFVRKYAQEMDEYVMQAHIRTYVNDFSVEPGEAGYAAIAMLTRKSVGLI